MEKFKSIQMLKMFKCVLNLPLLKYCWNLVSRYGLEFPYKYFQHPHKNLSALQE
mgnify:CR=1 FL=1